MSEEISIVITRDLMKRGADRLIEFLARGERKISKGAALEAYSRALGYGSWNILSSKLPPEPEELEAEEANRWLPETGGNLHYLAVAAAQSVIIVIPRADLHLEALTWIRKHLGEDFHGGTMGLIENDDQWSRDTEISATYFKEEWRSDSNKAVNAMIDFGERRYIMGPLMDPALIDIAIDARVSGFSTWGVMVAEDLTDALCQLVESPHYVRFPNREFNLEFWPIVEGVGQIPAPPSPRWRVALNAKLQAKKEVHRSRFPYKCLTRQQYDEVVRLAIVAERYLRKFFADNPGRVSSDAVKEAIYSPEVDGKFKFLETLPQLALVELMATVLLSRGQEQVEWADILGQAAENLLRYPEKVSDFVAQQTDLSLHLKKGLQLLQERRE